MTRWQCGGHVLFSVYIAVLCFFVLCSTASAAINEQLTFYGTLQNSSGSNLSGTYDMVFRFYDAPTGGTLLDTSTHTAGNGNPVTVSNGEFTVQLGSGSGNALDGLDFNTGALYVGLSIEGDSEISPRERLGAAPYSFNSETLDGYDSSELFQTAGTNTILTTSSDTLLTITQNGTGDLLNLFDGGTEVFSILDGGNVGIGTSAPAYQLSVAGDMQLTGALYDAANTAPAGYVLESTATGVQWVATSTYGGGGGGSSLFTDTGTYVYLTDTNDNLAIGTTSGSAKLTVFDSSVNILQGGSIEYQGIQLVHGSSTTNNLMIGFRAGDLLIPASLNNILLGADASANASTSVIQNNIVVGYLAGYNMATSSQNVIAGYRAGYNNVGDDNILVGPNTGYSNYGSHNICSGMWSCADSTGSYNVGLGYYAGLNFQGVDSASLGYSVGYYPATSTLNVGTVAGQFGDGSHNINFGYEAGVYNDGSHSILIGHEAATDNGILGQGIGTIAIGNEATTFAEAVSYTVALGSSAGEVQHATSSVFVGASAFYSSGEDRNLTDNVAFGSNSGNNMSDFANYNTLLGYAAAFGLSNASSTIAIGYSNDNGIGFNTQRFLNIGNQLFGTGLSATGTDIASGARIGIGVNAPTAQLHTTGSVRLANFGAGTLQTDASGNVSVSSDERLKNVVENFNDGLASILGIEPIVYKWNNESGFETETEYIGFSAQNVQDNIPGAVGKDKHGFLTLSDRGILASVVNAVRELAGIIETDNTAAAENEAAVYNLEQEQHALRIDALNLDERITDLEGTLDIESEPRSTTTPAIPETATTTATSTNTNTE